MTGAPPGPGAGVPQPTASAPLRLAFLGDPQSIHLRRWLALFAGQGHEIHLLLEDERADPIDLAEGIVVTRFASYGERFRVRGAVRARRSLQSLVSRIRPDVLHAHYLVRYGWLGALAGYHPYVLSVWGSDVLLGRDHSIVARTLSRWSLGSADLVTGVSDNLLRAAVARGAAPGRCRIAQFGVDGDAFQPGEASSALSERLGLRGRRMVFSPRILAPVYRHDVELAALASLPDDVVLVWAAMHPASETVDALMTQARALGVVDRLLVVPEIRHDEMPDFYRLADVVVSVPESDAFPVTLLEAMACGRPVVATRLPAIEEGWTSLPQEWLVPVGDADATAAAIRRALALDRAARDELGRQLRARALARADERASLLAMERVYWDLAATPGAAARA